MKQHILPAVRLTLTAIVLFMITYPLIVFAIAQTAPAKAMGETVVVNGRVVGYQLEGQLFTAGRYFQGRPSATGYNAAGSGGSNKGPSNPAYLQEVRDRIDTFLAHNPSVRRSELPSELVTASGSGLDPHISVKAAEIQVPRVAKARRIPETVLLEAVRRCTEHHWFTQPTINVLKLNLATDTLTQHIN